MLNRALVGCGDISNKRVAPAIMAQKNSKLCAAVSPYELELDEFIKKHGIKDGYTVLDQMLERNDIHAVYIATPIFLHYES